VPAGQVPPADHNTHPADPATRFASAHGAAGVVGDERARGLQERVTTVWHPVGC